MIHHVSDVSKVMKECYRILEPKGVLIVNTCSTEQIWGRWYLSLIPEATEKVAKKLRKILQSLILHRMFIHVPILVFKSKFSLS